VCDRVLGKVRTYYGFKPGSNPTTIEQNKQLTSQLLDEDTYVYDLKVYISFFT
jgi:hypothetical protein